MDCRVGNRQVSQTQAALKPGLGPERLRGFFGGRGSLSSFFFFGPPSLFPVESRGNVEEDWNGPDCRGSSRSAHKTGILPLDPQPPRCPEGKVRRPLHYSLGSNRLHGTRCGNGGRRCAARPVRFWRGRVRRRSMRLNVRSASSDCGNNASAPLRSPDARTSARGLTRSGSAASRSRPAEQRKDAVNDFSSAPARANEIQLPVPFANCATIPTGRQKRVRGKSTKRNEDSAEPGARARLDVSSARFPIDNPVEHGFRPW